MDNELIKSFYDHRNQEQAKKMSAYMKDNFAYLGIQKPLRGELQKEFFKKAKNNQKVNWDLIYMLWNLPEREFQYLAVDYLLALKDSLQKSDLDRVKRLIINKSWWDSVDPLATNITGIFYN